MIKQSLKTCEEKKKKWPLTPEKFLRLQEAHLPSAVDIMNIAGSLMNAFVLQSWFGQKHLHNA